MMYLSVFGLVMAVLTVIFWICEIVPFVRAVRNLNLPSSHNKLKATYQSFVLCGQFVLSLRYLWKFAADLIATCALVTVFGFTGVVGSIAALTASNILSVYILTIKPKQSSRPDRKGGAY